MREEAAERLAGAGADPAAAAVWRAELVRLDAVEEGLCFGRLDLRDGRRVHIGRLSLFREGQDDPLLLDWRAPAARPFYTATAVVPEGVWRRRHITTRGRVVVALDDELLDLDHTGDHFGGDTLVGEAALLAAVTAGRTGRMRDVVATLQTEQDRIVRDGYRGVLVVEGGPGTGKTVVALHRVAHLLYAHPHLRTRGVLVVGPSRLFLEHIGRVLPGLGEGGVVTSTVVDLLPGVRVGRVDPPATAERKGRADLAGLLAAAVRDRVRVPDEPVEVEFERLVLRLDPATCRRAVRAARATGLPHEQAGLVFQREVVDALARQFADCLEAVTRTDTGEAIDGGSPDGRLGEADLRALAAAGVVLGPDDLDAPRDLLDEVDLAGLRNSLLADPGVRAALDALWPPLTPERVVADLLAGPAAGDAPLLDGHGAPGTGDWSTADWSTGDWSTGDWSTADWSTADVPLLDEAAALLGTGAPPTFGHVVVDEAQELSAMAWRMLARRCPAKWMTVVGDLAQTGDPAGASSWARVLEPHVGDRWRQTRLTVNYRAPAEVVEATADLLAAHHPGTPPPRSVRSTGQPPWRLRTTRAALPRTVARLVAEHVDGRPAADHVDGRLAVVVPRRHLAALAGVVPPGCLSTPDQVKGLEFDSVLVVDPAAILADSPLGHNDLYVAMTRTTRELGIVHPGPPPAEVAGVRPR
ncbi:HelD family protein [Saccharothrix syringae]|uniref:Helicase n=1 Tax=Saccharothrix syringae TaxID=103733 RepID=A0A5Q0HDY8_SACSY|nr:helicase [Saccharothrix syringae]